MNTIATTFDRRRLLLGAGATAFALAAASTTTRAGPTALARARHHYDQFAAAMDELTIGHHGWLIGGGHRREFAALGCRTIEDASWLGPKLVTYEAGTDPRCPSGVIEWNHDIIGLQKQPSGWLDEPLYRDGKGVRL
ncbi:hypothetical protein [Mesorhizobium sp. LSJC285A00]|uniref:hypothetical protein n=1 Tax=Mesorhizobium sp. LSJC285A00 TaxID=1287338 RepID=UPI0004283D6B|nr:hypothetical protein [Mesorhizobium sp. LSJC285A00]